MLNTSEQPKKVPPKMITMQDVNGVIVEIPVEQENIVTIFKSLGYREAKLEPETETNHVDAEQ